MPHPAPASHAKPPSTQPAAPAAAPVPAAADVHAAAAAEDTTVATIEQVAAPVIAKTADIVDAKAGTYAVAPGRTVSHAGDSGSEPKPYGPGEKLKLSADEATRLLKLGFILDKDGSMIIQADGPAVNVDNGVQIAQPA